jgi:hypothetical protein
MSIGDIAAEQIVRAIAAAVIAKRAGLRIREVNHVDLLIVSRSGEETPTAQGMPNVTS